MQAQVEVLAAGVVRMMVEIPDLPCLMKSVHESRKALLNDFTSLGST